MIAFMTMAAPAQEAPRWTGPVVSATGNAEIETTPDMATIRLGVEAQGATAMAAQNSVNTVAQKIIAAALKVVGDRKLIQTSDLSLFPEYLNRPNEAPKITGYRARNVVTVRLENIEKVGTLVDDVTQAGATNVDSISFGLKNDKEARKAALRDAVREAREKAEAMADGLGMKLGDVETVEEGGQIVRTYAMDNFAELRAAKAPVMPGQVSVSGSVTVRFRLVK